MDSTIIVAIIGMIGVVITSLLTHTVENKKTRNDEQRNYDIQMIELITKYKERCDDLEEKVNNLEKKVEYLQKENIQLRSIMTQHGIEIVSNSNGG